MGYPVHVIGIGADAPAGLSPRALEALASATWIAGGKRHLALLGRESVESFTITNNVQALVERLRDRGPKDQCVVLASGDPLFFGIGKALVEELGPEQVIVEPAVSSLQLAFARAGLPWETAAIGSIHGRPLDENLLPLLGRPVIGLFTHDGQSPSAVASFFLARGLDDYDAWVGEALGTEQERATAVPLRDLVGRRFADLNVLILRRKVSAQEFNHRACRSPAGLPDDRFAQPEVGPVLLTHADVRAVTLARFHDLPAGPIWDVGAGLGGVAVELGRAFPDREIVAVERSDAQRAYLEANRLRFATYNVRIVAGEAPEALANDAAPAAVFLGGSGGRLEAILDLVCERLRRGGCLVANFVTIENLSRSLERLRAERWRTEATHIQISHAQPLGALTALAPLRPVWIVRACRVNETSG